MCPWERATSCITSGTADTVVLAPGLIAGLLDLALAQSLRQLLRSLSLVGLVLLTTYKTVRDLAPSYLSDVIIPYIPSRVLRFQTSELRIHIVLPMRNNLFYSDQHRISLTLVLVVCSHKLQAVSLSCCPIPPPPPSFRLPSDGPWALGNIYLSWFRIIPWALLDHCSTPYICISVKCPHCDVFCFTANYFMWPALFQVTALERRSLGSGTTWRWSVVSRTHTLYIYWYLYQIFC